MKEFHLITYGITKDRRPALVWNRNLLAFVPAVRINGLSIDSASEIMPEFMYEDYAECKGQLMKLRVFGVDCVEVRGSMLEPNDDPETGLPKAGS